MSRGGSLTKPDLLKSFQIRLTASAESIWTFNHIQGKRKDEHLFAFFLISYYTLTSVWPG